MKILKKYQEAFGKEMGKSCLITHKNVDFRIIRKIKRWTGYNKEKFNFQYQKDQKMSYLQLEEENKYFYRLCHKGH